MMISKIILKQVATYDSETIIDDLRKINFFYGANGSGKTTISKVIDKTEDYPNCKINWEYNQKLKLIIFNEDFIKNYFYEKDNLLGIYTIGEGAKDIEEKIEDKKGEKDSVEKELNILNNTERKKEEEKSQNWEKFKESCWKRSFQKYKKDFDSFFTGYKNNKDKFAEKILEENNNQSELLDIYQIKNKYDLLYGKDTSQVEELKIIPDGLVNKVQKVENNEILKTSIVGKKDINIAKMIEKLHNHDWIKQGKEYYDNNYDKEERAYICPFCQQKTTEEFRKQLEEYFDETYNNQIKQLGELLKEYETITKEILSILNDNYNSNNKYLDEDDKKQRFKDKIDLLKQKISNNKASLDNKEQNPSIQIALESIISKLDETNDFNNEVNQNIKNHNKLLLFKKDEKVKLDKELWKFLSNEVVDNVDNYKKENESIEKAFNEIKEKINKYEVKKTRLENEISELEKQIKSVKPAVNAINKILENFGFKGFKLKPSKDDIHYEILRDDGSPAKNTISEGERNFLVFLYFYQLIQGVMDPEENISEDRIIIFDDPVSSLDSDVLFIVSTLIRDILDKIREDKGNLKQIFVLTHNAYFFKEITYISYRDSGYNERNDTRYYIVRKINNSSCIEKYKANPIRTSYQLLWDDIKNSERDNISVQNSMRRIIEFYFKLLADINYDRLMNHFEGDEKIICRSLISWINIGSHEIFDDVNFSITDESIDKFKKVFKKIFEFTGHIQHYNMMMGINENKNLGFDGYHEILSG